MKPRIKTIPAALLLALAFPLAGNATQIKTPTVSTPHVTIRSNAPVAGKVVVPIIHKPKTVDASQPNLFQSAATGKHYPISK
jgi:hypothetical protein